MWQFCNILCDSYIRYMSGSKEGVSESSGMKDYFSLEKSKEVYVQNRSQNDVASLVAWAVQSVS